MKNWWSARHLPRALRRAMRERRSLEDRPWEEDLLHWAKDGTLHGSVPPPSDGKRRSITTDGWCPGWALELQRRYLSSSLGATADPRGDPRDQAGPDPTTDLEREDEAARDETAS